ncbi:hypothetical protein AVEN_5668-1 [Araneus ventricosus]|uniref:Uncharacterized protein n=1 Tax=Araneus ventricosus TaxID=182803 RepID=A0A4Y2MVR7_ARAVE|nr:hypothetical protein AVEN_5668-1 [Araneus ventricosus]
MRRSCRCLLLASHEDKYPHVLAVCGDPLERWCIVIPVYQSGYPSPLGFCQSKPSTCEAATKLMNLLLNLVPVDRRRKFKRSQSQKKLTILKLEIVSVRVLHLMHKLQSFKPAMSTQTDESLTQFLSTITIH